MEQQAKLRTMSSSETATAIESKEFERLYDKFNYQNNNLRDNVSELFTLSNRLKMRGPTSMDKCSKERLVPDSDIVGSLWSESYKIEDLNQELREIINHLNSVI